MNTGEKGIELIKSFEGCRLTAYKDSVGVLTIGYGHTEGVKYGMSISQNKAEELLKNDLVKYENYVKKYITYALNQNQFDALVSFTYNLGGGNLQKSDLRKYLNAGYIEKAANEFDKWVYAGGKKLTGLVRRRAAEKALFLTPVKEESEMVEESNIEIDGKTVPVRRILKNGTNFIAIRDIASALGYDISNKGSTAVLTKM